MNKRYFKRSKNNALDALAEGYSNEYANEKFAQGYVEITEEKYRYYMSHDEMHVYYDFE